MKDAWPVRLTESVYLALDANSIDNDHRILGKFFAAACYAIADPSSFCLPVELLAVSLHGSTLWFDLARKLLDEILRAKGFEIESLDEKIAQRCLS
jgi:hypothetical protein